MFKKVLAIMLAVFMLAGVLSITVFAEEGEEPETPPTEIYTIEDLYMINYNLDGNFILMNDIDMTEATAEGGDFDYMGNGWEPIGSNGIYSDATPFTGTFDGNGYKIIGMRINVKTLPSGVNSMIFAGLFAYNTGTIKNLGVSGDIISMTYGHIGGIAGFSSGTITDCFNNANVTSSVSTSNFSPSTDASGIATIGIDGYINNCYNTGIVTTRGNYSYSGSISSSGRGTVTNCYYLNGTGDKVYNTGVKALTEGQMKLKGVFGGFDFDNVWYIDSESDYPYPQVRHMYPAETDPTEAPTEEPTEEPTEAPTEAPTVIKVVYVLGDVDGDLDAGIIDATYIQRYNAGFNTPFAIGEPIDIG